MKKLVKIFVFILALIFSVPMCLTSNAKASASADSKVSVPVASFSDFSVTVNSIINDYALFSNRIAGSEGEKNASEYIRNYLKLNTKLVALDNAFVKNGVQTFKYESELSGLYETSQNLIFTLKSNKETAKKVIIGCHYDAFAIDMNLDSEKLGEYIDSESINGSAGNVALVLSLAKYLPAYDEFNVEFVFFGAGEDNYAGSSYYTKGISEEDKENIICMINVNQIALGKSLYFYMNEIGTKTSKYLENLTYDNRINIDKINVVNLAKQMTIEKTPLGLDYTHVALESDNVNFMKEGIETVNIFAGDYSEGVIIGRQEFSGSNLLTYTEKDSREFISMLYEDYKIENNLYEVFKMVGTMLSDSKFISTFESAKGSTTWFYNLFTNDNLVLCLTAIVFIIFIVVAMFIYYKLSVKAYYADIEVEFLSSVVKISDELDKSGKDENVTKVVSQVIANDIKKDKVIKVKPEKSIKKDKDEDKK